MVVEKLVVEGLTKRFGDLIAVNNVNFKVLEGELFSLLGPSGCGKTTTLRCISGLEKPDSGKIYIGGREVTHLPPQERGVCLVFQEYAVFPHMSVFDNIAFGLKVRKLPQAEIESKVYRLAELLGLREILNKKAGTLGLSEKQRVSLARCLAVEPEILLLDEPLTLVDAKVKERMRRELRRLQRELKITILYVTHDQLEAMMLSDRIAIMDKGKILQIGSPNEIYETPSNIFVARFVGSPTINLIEGGLELKDGEIFFSSDSLKINITPMKKVIEGYEGSEVVLGIRPEDLKVYREPPDQPPYVKSVIEMLSHVGDRMEVYLKVGQQSLVALSPLRSDLKVSDEVYLQFPIGSLHLFDKKSGKRLGVMEL